MYQKYESIYYNEIKKTWENHQLRLIHGDKNAIKQIGHLITESESAKSAQRMCVFISIANAHT